MTARIKEGENLLWNEKDTITTHGPGGSLLLLNFNERWSYLGFKQKGDTLTVYTEHGNLVLRFTSRSPKWGFDHQEKEQVMFKAIKI